LPDPHHVNPLYCKILGTLWELRTVLTELTGNTKLADPERFLGDCDPLVEASPGKKCWVDTYMVEHKHITGVWGEACSTVHGRASGQGVPEA